MISIFLSLLQIINIISKMQQRQIELLVLFMCLVTTYSEAVLNGYPIIFNLAGTTTFMPDAGGSAQSGYTINLGFTGLSWIAAELVTPAGNTDVLVVTIDDFYSRSLDGSASGHLVTYKDYNRDASGLKLDSITQYDVSSYAYTSKMTYSLPITRTLSSNSGQDWSASSLKYSVLKVCFYSSGKSFSVSDFNQYYSVCYNYQINNLLSTFVGPYIKSFMFNGYNTSIYGYIDGQYVKNKLYFYQESALYSYVQVPALAIEIGTTAGGQGQDFYVYSPIASECGDYYGADINHISLDNYAAGYQNEALTLNHWNADPGNPVSGLSMTALRISFSRDVYTYDSYDKTMLSTFLFCFYIYTSGSITGSLSDKACQMVELSTSYLQMSVPSSFQAILGAILVGVGLLLL